MYEYRVGTLYNANTTRWSEGAEYNYRSGVHEIRLFFRNPKPGEVQAAKQGEANFALVVQQDIILLVFRYGIIPWSDAPYAWYRVPENERTVPPDMVSEQERMPVTLFMVNADTGILLAIRQTSFSHDFSTKLHRAIREQIVRPFDQVLYDRQLRMLYSRYDSQGLLTLAIARCKGGD